MNDEAVQWTVSSGERAELKRGAGRDCDGVWVRDFPGCARPKTLSRAGLAAPFRSRSALSSFL